MSNIFSRIADALLHLIGVRKDKPVPLHAHYYSAAQAGYGFEGYWAYNTITLRAAGTGFDAALSRVATELNRGAKEAGLPYTFVVTSAIGESVLVQWDTGGKVQSAEAGRTPPDEIIGYIPAMPWAHKHVAVYVKRGVSGEELYTLLLHEIFTHAAGLEHSPDTRDVGHPSAKVGRLSAADIQTWEMASQRRKRDGLE
jgi:hypothetical protein